jgi:hypothetical protein
MSWDRPAICISTFGLLAATAAPVLADPVTAPAPGQPSYSELVDEVRALRAEMSQLRARERNYVSAAEVDATVKRVLDDAERRSRFLDVDPATAGWDGERFYIRSPDKKFSISPTFRIQNRYIASYRGKAAGPDDETRVDDGFETRRLRFGLEGNLFSEDLTFRFVYALDQDNDAGVRDAWIRYRFNPDVALQVGQFKDPWIQEEKISSGRQLAVERSIVNALVGGGYTRRVDGANLILGQGDPWRTYLLVHDGANSAQTRFNAYDAEDRTPVLGDADATFGSSARLEYFAAGNPDQSEDYSARDNKKEDLLVFGAGAHFTQLGDNDALFHALDVQWKNTRGTGAFAEYIGLFRQIESPSDGPDGTTAGDFYDYGAMAQIGQMVAPKWELFARYGYVRLDDESFSDERETRQEDVHEITTGVNYFIYGHNAKLTIDVSYLPNGSPEAPRLGYLATEQNGIVVRTQFQLNL